MANWTHNVLVNTEEHREYAHWLGYALLNCAVIELFTYTFTAAIRQCDVFSTGLNGKSYSARSKSVRHLVGQAAISDDLKAKVKSAWQEADAVMKQRNIIAHNPITILNVRDADGAAKSQNVSVIDMTATTDREAVRYIQAAELGKLVNRAQAVTAALNGCLAQIRSQMAESTRVSSL